MELADFVEFCRNTSDKDQIYELYNNDAALCEDIYAQAAALGVELQDTPEPMRASLEAIGLHYAVQVLADW